MKVVPAAKCRDGATPEPWKGQKSIRSKSIRHKSIRPARQQFSKVKRVTCGFGFWVLGFGIWVWGLGFRVQGSGFMLWVLESVSQGEGQFGISRSGIRVHAAGMRKRESG